ncbi:MAG: histidine phosphatase family protein [Chloroflexi bacterium]|nr:histidine phosphatase family protein [Chloroflexota bacterium]
MNMTTTLLLVRHAQTASNVSGRYMGWIDEDLSAEGVSQAERLAWRLSRRPISTIFSSPLKRALSTARATALPHGLTVQVMPELGEIRMGQWEGLFAADIQARFPALWKTWRTDPSTIEMPGGESLSQVAERADIAFHRILEQSQGRQVVAVTHDVIARIIVARSLNVSTSIYRRLEVANASLTTIESFNGACRLRSLNDTAHLQHKLADDHET